MIFVGELRKGRSLSFFFRLWFTFDKIALQGVGGRQLHFFVEQKLLSYIFSQYFIFMNNLWTVCFFLVFMMHFHFCLQFIIFAYHGSGS